MRSIRLALMIYFLALLAVALTAASLLVYRNAEQTLQAKQQAMQQLIETQYNELCREWDARLDADLLSQAQSLARLVQVQFEGYHLHVIQSLLLFGVSSTTLSPNAHVLTVGWLPEGFYSGWGVPPNPLYQDVRRHLRPNLKPGIKLKLDQLGLADIQVSDFFQIDTPGGQSWYSQSMANRSFSFRLDTSVFEPNDVLRHHYDDTRLGDTPVRRVVLKSSGVPQEFSPPSPPPGRRENAPGGSRSRGVPSGPPPIRRGPTIYVHCAAKLDKRDAAFAGFGQRRDDELTRVAGETRQSLADLRIRLLGISLVVFATTAVGSFWLVRLGLSPLRRLSDAVSRVSVKNFRLPLDDQPLPLELRPIAERLTGTLDLLKRAFAREKQASADISHELRTPLAALLTTIEFALRKPRAAEQYRQLFSDCRASVQQMNQIVERLLTLARLDAGVDRLRVQSVDAAALAGECAAMIRPLAEARGLKLTVKCPHPPGADAARLASAPANGDGACLVQSDPDKLREIVSNLLHNAIQYNRPGGSVDLRVARENGTLEIEVEDTGIGIAEEARERIFERFYRADPSRGGDDLHAGLGLAIVKEYIDLMGGSIGVESREGQGSTFRVLLPAR
jgi:signal transduction histidine kinase